MLRCINVTSNKLGTRVLYFFSIIEYHIFIYFPGMQHFEIVKDVRQSVKEFLIALRIKLLS